MRRLLNTWHSLSSVYAEAVRHSSSSSTSLLPPNFWCVGRNYAEHAKELGNVLGKGEPTDGPMIFLKSGSTMLPSETDLQLPSWSANVHHEIELAIEVDGDGKPVRGAVALDLTARDVQQKLKDASWPWTLAKSFPHSTPLGMPFSLKGVDVQKLELLLTVNGKTRQKGVTSDMLYSVTTIIQYVKDHFPITQGDVILTGTPHGVSAVVPGDKLVAQVLSEGKVLSEGSWTVSQKCT